jgi:hypothetical protein
MTALMGGHYKTYIISGVSHPRSDLIMSLMLWKVAYNIQSINVVLQVTRNIANPAEKGKYFE